jgi:hypothetical protein
MIKDVKQECNEIIDPVEQAEYREYGEELTAKLLAIYKYREKEEKEKK